MLREPSYDKGLFSDRSFDLLGELRGGTKQTYERLKPDLDGHVVGPFKELMIAVADRLPPDLSAVLETRRRLYGQFLKNDYGRGGVNNFYWGAFYPRDGEGKTRTAQLLLFLSPDYLEFGFYTGWRAGEAKERFRDNCGRHGSVLRDLLLPSLDDPGIRFGSRNHQVADDGSVRTLSPLAGPDQDPRDLDLEEEFLPTPPLPWRDYATSPWSTHPEVADPSAVTVIPRGELVSLEMDALADRVARTFVKLFPLVLVATSTDVVREVRAFLGRHPGEPGSGSRVRGDPGDRREVPPGGVVQVSTGIVAPAPRADATISRIIRDTAVTRRVKELHDFRCQICGTRLETAAGAYAEGAHIRPLGSPHDGPDGEDNVLCLCPNHHVLLDRGGFAVADDLTLIGIEGKLRTVPGHSPNPRHLAYHRDLGHSG